MSKGKIAGTVEALNRIADALDRAVALAEDFALAVDLPVHYREYPEERHPEGYEDEK
jgi:hypothetical protein